MIFALGVIVGCIAFVAYVVYKQKKDQDEKLKVSVLKQQEVEATKTLYPHHELVKRPVRRKSNCEVGGR